MAISSVKPKKSLMLKEKDKSVIARLLDVDTSHFYELLRVPGFPREDKNGFYNVVQVMKWYIGRQRETYKNQKSVYQEYRIRLLTAQAKKTEMELKIMEQESLPSEDLQNQILFFLGKLKSDFLDMPGKLSPYLENKPAQFIKTIIEKNVILIMNAAADGVVNIFESEKSDISEKEETVMEEEIESD